MEASHVPHLQHPGRTVVISLVAALVGAALATATFALINIEDEPIAFVSPSAEPATSNETATLRYDGGPQEGAAQLSIGTQPVPAAQADSVSVTRYDGGPEEGVALLSVRSQPAPAADAQSAAGIRYDGGPEEGTRAVPTQPSAESSGPTPLGARP